MTKKQIFNKVKKHLLTQLERAEYQNECRYKYMPLDEDGVLLQCAVGCLIPDKYYDNSIEGSAVTDENVVEILVQAGVLDKRPTVARKEKIDLLRQLQEIHDNELVVNWVYKLEILELSL